MDLDRLEASETYQGRPTALLQVMHMITPGVAAALTPREHHPRDERSSDEPRPARVRLLRLTLPGLQRRTARHTPRHA